MSIIQPETTITLYYGIPITGNQNILFKDLEEQRTFFNAHVLRTISECTYQEKTGVIQLEFPYSEMYLFNYISWKNAAFENKTVYARVINVEHDNNEMMNIEFAIDWFQTLHFTFSMKKCVIQRQHLSTVDYAKEQANVLDKSIMSTLTPEPLNFSDGIKKKGVFGENIFYQPFIDFSENAPAQLQPQIVVITSQDIVQTSDWGGAPQMAWVNSLNMARTSNNKFFNVPSLVEDGGTMTLQEYINQYTVQGMVNSILGIYVVPKLMNPTYYQQFTNFPITVQGLQTRNGKISRFPWRYIRLHDFSGNKKEYQLEKFNAILTPNGDFQARFGMFMMINGYPQVVIVPYSYDGVESELGQMSDLKSYNFREKMVITDFPQLSYNTDGYLSWLGGQLRGGLTEQVYNNPLEYSSAFQTAKAIGGTVSGAAGHIGVHGRGTGETPTMHGMGQFGIGQTAEIYEQAWGVGRRRALKNSADIYAQGMEALQSEPISDIFEIAKPAFAADQYHLAATSGATVAYPFNRMGFIAEIVQPWDAIVEQYDNYYDKFGYASGNIDYPLVYQYIKGLGAEPRFTADGETYIKTENATVRASMKPAEDYIKAMFDGGHIFLKGTDLINA